MGKFKDKAYNILDDACYYISISEDQRTEHPTSCQATLLSSENFKKSMTKAFQTLYSLQQMCDIGDQPSSEDPINQCKKGDEWREQDFVTKKYTFLDSMLASFTSEFLDAEQTSHRGERSIQWSTAMSLVGPILLTPNILAHMAARNITVEEVLSRHPRFVISGPILIGIAVGAGVITTARATAHFVAKEETSRVVEEVQAGRREDIANNIQNSIKNHNYTRIVAKGLDIIRLTEVISTHSIVLLHDSEDLNKELSHLASRKDKLRYSSPFTEEWWAVIKEMNSQHNIGITSSEVNMKTGISAELSTLVTTLAPINNSSSSCKDQLLTKTLMVPIVDHRGRTEITLKDGRMFPRGGNGSQYYIISRDAVLSKETQFFG